ncbi:glycoside hydrolase family 2 TIM barrel-domain containing protein [Persicitalea sp.]|uniref:glycoside hydrolase family 2 protein n=1 Tax=Persicitalea sp. TaxID=3100273 RepID=UPI0035936999
MYNSWLRKAITLFLFGLSGLVSAQQSQRIYLSGTDKDHSVPWDFFCTKGMNSGRWTKIAVPSNWELQGFGKYSYGTQNRQDSTKADETGLYKHNFTVPKEWKSQRVFIVFEGAMTDTEVTFNGKSVGETHQGGFTQFRYEITPFIKIGRNLLAVTVHKESANRSVDVAERHGDFWAFGGIYRPVYLDIVPQQFIERVAIDAQADGQFLVDVFSSNATANQTLTAQVQTLAGDNVGAAFSANTDPANPKTTLKQAFQNVNQWTAETPALYQVVVSLAGPGGVMHTLTQRFGFRTIEVRKSDGIYVNGRKVMLRGVNRHTFVPETGRTTSKTVSIDDIKLMQAMNMNAVRMSHYPPDVHFLDACDSLGMYVLDELTGWQKKYDTLVGQKLVKELVIRDVNHPSVLFWDNGNEGGWNRGLDDDFAKYDPQKRPVLHPWERFGGFETKHYITYNYLVNSALYDPDILMPTEFMHGLFDGGHGAGLDDFWELMLRHPHSSGGFLWVFADEGVMHTDKKNADGSPVIDVFGTNAPDGIVGPHHEKEASFYTIKEIWPPIRITRTHLPRQFEGKLAVENHYSFTDLSQCQFSWQLVSFPQPTDSSTRAIVNQAGTLPSKSVPPGETGYLDLNLPPNWTNSEALYLTATDPNGHELFTWSWPISASDETAANTVVSSASPSGAGVSETDTLLTVQTGSQVYTFDKTTGYLMNLSNSKSDIVLANGPMLAGVNMTLKSFRYFAGKTGYEVIAKYDGGGNQFTAHWLLVANQPAELTYEYVQRGEADLWASRSIIPKNSLRA